MFNLKVRRSPLLLQVLRLALKGFQSQSGIQGTYLPIFHVCIQTVVFYSVRDRFPSLEAHTVHLCL